MSQSTLKPSGATSASPGELRAAEVEAGGADEAPGGVHVGIIMDGNGRWARRRDLPRVAGHRAGASAVRRTVAAAPDHGIGTLTLYAFSSDNWRRPALEVGHLMRLLRTHLRSEADRCVEEGVRVSVIGRRDRLAPSLVAEIRSVEERTRAGRTLHLRLAIDYSARDAILKAASLAAARQDGDGSDLSREDFARLISRAVHAVHAEEPTPDVDLVIRTAGEQRLSDFLLWESAYAELFFTPCLWPEFDEARLASAMEWFGQRERRFGGLSPERTLATKEG